MEEHMTNAIEHIGELQYAPNPEYPYPFPVELPPHFWMTEQTGKLAEAVEVYLDGERLSPQALDLIKQYLRQYIERALLTGDAHRPKLLQALAKLKNNKELEAFTDELAEVGIEPL
jgi:hypothetical protein